MIQLILNERAGGAAALSKTLARAGLELRPVPPEAIGDTIDAALDGGARRVAVAGGDGTLAGAASRIAGTDVELAIVPAGTLNHFATDLGIPSDPAQAAALARDGARTVMVDVGWVNGRLMLNTSSIGMYAAFVRHRDRLESRLGYTLASLVAAVRTLRHLRRLRVELEVDGRVYTYRTPLLFIGVGERELQVPMLGGRVADGRRGLHVLVVRRRSAWGVLALAVSGALRGVREITRTSHVDSYFVTECRVHLRRRTVVAVDGELLTLDSPVEYRLEHDALRVVVPGNEG